MSIRRSILGLLVVLGLVAPHAATAKKPKVQCTQQTEGTQAVARVATSSRGYKLEIMNTRLLDDASGAQRTVLTKRGQPVLEIETSLAGDGVLGTHAVFGPGFKGMRELTLTPDGDRYRVVIDGRRSLPFAATDDPSTVAFEDGQPAPELRPAKSLAKTLKKLGRQLAKNPCTKGIRPLIDAESDLDCVACQLGCGLTFQGCNFAAVAAGPSCFFICTPVALGACQSALRVCLFTEPGCYKLGNSCCPAGCVQPDNMTKCCDKGQECYDVEALGGGTFKSCCGTGRVCGNHCLAPDERCVDAERSWYCPGDRPGELCDDPEQPVTLLGNNREATCCGADERCARKSVLPVPDDWPYDPSSYRHLCCPGGGTECGLACCPTGTTCCRIGSQREGDEPLCCPAGQVCDGTACCTQDRLCGGKCCNGPCVNGSCCAPGQGTPCAGQCCFGGFTSCCNGQCCAGSCCNNQCCPGLCLGGVCCPTDANDACGAPGAEMCCPKNYDCLNNQCIPCACPANQDCCGDTCCPVGKICCIPPTGGLPRGCYTQQQCFPIN